MTTTVLIADSMKPSLVMSSEVFKDKIPGATIHVASTGEEAIAIADEHNPDICLVDFDLPDVDGPALVVALRRVYKGPILMTAYPDKNVHSAVLDDLYAFNDASGWISKPLKFDDLAEKIDQFLLEKQRTGRRFDTDIPMQLVGKAEGRGKRAPKIPGRLVNLSMGGACIQLDEKARMKKKQEMTLTFEIPSKRRKKPAKTARTRKSLTTGKSETKIKATICWITKTGQVGLQFGKLSDGQLRELEGFFRTEAKLLASDV